MSWYDHIKAYVWNDDTTPYLVPVHKLKQSQQDKELFVFTVSIVVLFGITTMGAIHHWRQEGEGFSLFVAVHGLSIVWAAILVGMHHHLLAAQFLLSAPIVAFIIILNDGLGIKLEGLEKWGLLAFMVLWGRYGLRVVKITQTPPYEGEPDPSPVHGPELVDRLAARLEALNEAGRVEAAREERENPPKVT